MRSFVLVALVLLAACSPAPEAATYDTAWTAFRQGRLVDAQAQVEQALAAQPRDLELQLLHAEILLSRGQVRQGLDLIDSIPEPADRSLKLRWMADRAEALDKTGRAPEVMPLLDEIDRLAGQEPSDAAFKARQMRAVLLVGASRNAEAEEVLRDVAARAAKANDSFNQAAALLNFSFSKVRAERYDDSLAYSISAVRAAELAASLRLAAVANNNLGIAYTVLGDLQRAEQHIEMSVRDLRETGDARNLIDALGELGNVHLRKNAPERAQPLFEEAVRTAIAVEFRGGAALWSGQLALALIEQRKWAEAKAANDQARQLRGGDSLYLRLNDAAIARGLGRPQEAIDLYREILQRNPPQAYLKWMSHFGLGSLLAEAGQFDEANREYMAGLKLIEEIRSGWGARDYRIRYHDLKMRFFQEYVDFLVARGDRERALQVAEFSRVRVLMEDLGSAPESVGDVSIAALRQHASRTGSVLLSYWVAPKRSFVWAIAPGGVHMYELPGAETIGGLVRVYRKAIEQDLRDPIAMGLPQGEQLSAMLLNPVRERLAGVKHVAVVTDGSLHALNFETLPVGGKYWIEDVEVSVAPSLTVLAQSRARTVAAKPSLLVVGAPVLADPAFPVLPAAEAEVAGIQAKFLGRPQVIRTGGQATPTAFLESMPERYSLIHFAAHAEANPQSPLESAVILSREEDERYKLYARDIADLKLGADLVTISACRSAGAHSYGGEGLVGFAWAFLHAGARSVIAGLWDVGDESSAKLMTKLYEGLAQGRAPATALREAKLSLLHGAHRNPFYWAPYQIYTR